VVWEIVFGDLDSLRPEDVSELVDAGLVGAECPADSESLRVEPETIAAFNHAGGFDRSEDQDVLRLIEVGVQLGFAGAEGFPGRRTIAPPGTMNYGS